MNWYPVGKEGANTTYKDKSACEAAEGQACYDITGKDLRYHSVLPVALLDENSDPLLDGEGNPLYEYQLLEDAGLKTSVLSADGNLEASEAAVQGKIKNMEFGKRILAIVSIRNDAKSLSAADVLSISNTYAPIQALLLSGSIATAKAQIEAITPDGTLVTQADLDAIVAEIDAYLGV